MRHEMMKEFEANLLTLLRIYNPKLERLEADTRLEMDSLGMTEVCELVEEHCLVEATFAEVQELKTVTDLRLFIERKLQVKL